MCLSVYFRIFATKSWFISDVLLFKESWKKTSFMNNPLEKWEKYLVKKTNPLPLDISAFTYFFHWSLVASIKSSRESPNSSYHTLNLHFLKIFFFLLLFPGHWFHSQSAPATWTKCSIYKRTLSLFISCTTYTAV